MAAEMRIGIIGGGIAGLAAAWELEKARAAGEAVSYTLFEAGSRLGGSIASEVVNGTLLERGPDSFLTEKPAAAELCRELGLDGELIPSNDAGRRTCIVVRNRLVPLPDGLMFLVPTRLIPTALTPLFSLRSKIRMGLELLHRPRPAAADESVAALVERHYGAEAVDRLADPLLSGIYGGEAAELSAQAVLPRLVEMERKHGSLTRGMLAARRQIHARAQTANQAAKSVPPAIFTSLRGGMQQMVDAIAARLDTASLRLNAPVSGLGRTNDGWQVEAGGAVYGFDAVIVASQAWAAGALLGQVDVELAADLAAIPYSSSITVNLVYDEARMGALPEGFGFLVPASEGRAMLACTFVHRKFLGRTAPGKAVLRAFLGGTRNEALLAESDAALIAMVRRELSEILGSKVLPPALEPEQTQITRWRRAMAQYSVGHRERMARIAAHVAALPGLRLAGNAYDGIGIPDCVRLGRQAARELVARGAKAAAPVT
ncbi:MAG TPA: protoporphyrinogen oxidase [Terracidiphilus sp.]|jgi:oxygen-dependent protoporphyrinogen oxidase|nr:protoporphyrinogen oxidase [Terracidiphilus sp.]